ncbi:ATP-binding protein [Streptomyces sp. Pv4-95]|uniref:ATP-binding protein n=1 Tax=Streptomyces sp. Pv4-95 TaxID=3049543 RepID=UPI0038919F89
MTATLSTSASISPDTRHPGVDDQWQCACCFAERPEEVSATRDATRGFFDQVHPGNSADVEAAALVVSELVTNAIRHGHGPGTLTLTAHPDGLDITVTDPNPELPHARRPDIENGTGGLGWYLITAVCDELDAAPNPGGGKTVHAHLPWAVESWRVGAPG